MGWDRCELRKWLNSEFLTLCSDELRSIVRPVIKLTSAGNKSKDMIKSNDYFFILSEKELFGRAIYSAPGEGHWYEYYRQEDVSYFATDMDLERVIRWLRSATCGSDDAFCTCEHAWLGQPSQCELFVGVAAPAFVSNH